MHGVPWFKTCPSCGVAWPVVLGPYTNSPQSGTPFCAECDISAPWLSRTEILAWIRDNPKTVNLKTEDRHKLLVILEKLEALDPDDTKSVEAWHELQRVAPKVWEKTKPVRDALMGEAVKAALRLTGIQG